MERISVVIPTHNSSEFIGKTVESVFKQTLLPYEVIIVDDASNDSTVEVIAAIAKQAPVPVRLHRLSANSGGPALPLNVGISLASGSLIATLDHDDQMMPQKLELQLSCLNRGEQLGLVLSNFYFYRNNVRQEVAPLEILRTSVGAVALPLGESCYSVAARDLYAALIDKPIAGSCSNFLFPKQVWSECGGFDEQLTGCCDYGFLQAVARKHDIGVVDRNLFFYNWREDSLYRTARRLTSKRDQLRILGGFDAKLLSPDRQAKLRRRFRSEFLESASLLRHEGAYSKSLSHYLRSMYFGVRSKPGVFGWLKLITSGLSPSGGPKTNSPQER
jgi:glycosyltransferase involved in cell wall biosynthesis